MLLGRARSHFYFDRLSDELLVASFESQLDSDLFTDGERTLQVNQHHVMSTRLQFDDTARR